MKSRDRNLGMDRPISRRDLLHGMGALAATALCTETNQIFALEHIEAAGYPPALTGFRGSHVGSFEVAHRLARTGRRDWGTVQGLDNEIYDLVVVGGGFSGLAAAHFFLKQRPKARILILDNHDDFGGHARRNEFQVGGRTLIGYGGNQSLEAPSGYSDLVKGLLRDLGVDIERFETAFDQEFFKRHGLTAGIYFNRKDWGADRIVPFDLGTFYGFLPLAPSPLGPEEAVAQMPISEPARREFLRLLVTDEDQIPEIPPDSKEEYLYTLSYRDFLSKHLNIREAEVFAVLQDLTTDSGVGIEATPAYDALDYAGLPGWDAAGLPESEDFEPYIHHFPDGNASIARLMVRQMIPAVAPGNTMDDVVKARFDYSKLDRERFTRSTAPGKHRRRCGARRRSQVSQESSASPMYAVIARIGYSPRSCVLACDHAMIPYLCPELPAPQREALAITGSRHRCSIRPSLLRNWRAWKKLGIGAAVAPGSYHINAMLDFPVSIGGYSFAKGPDDPIAVPHGALSASIQ